MALMLIIECLEVGLSTLSKAAMRRGMSDFVFVVYSNALSVPILLFCCLLFHRRRFPPPLTLSILCRIFILGFISCSTQMFLFVGIRYSSPTLASAMTDLVPAFTFILAIISRMEKLDLKAGSCRAKCIGTIVSIIGALIVTIYKGPQIAFASSTFKILDENLRSQISNWVIGGFLLAISAVSIALFYVVQTSIIRDYPAELMLTFICHIFVTMQSSIVSLIAERDPSAWRLKPDVELIAVGYSAVLVLAFRGTAHAWVLHKKGPVFVAMFKPVAIVIAVVMGVTFLGDVLHLGSVIGAAIIAFGFYTVMWGKAKEEIEDMTTSGIDSSSHKDPLLQNKSTQV